MLGKVGYHIGLLIMSALQYLAPEFIQEHRLCWLRSPLYIVTNGKKHTYFYSDEEFNKARTKIKGDVSREKGLGALSATKAKESMFNPENQRMDILIPDEYSIQMLYDLMGEEVQPRKDFVFSKIDFSEIKE